MLKRNPGPDEEVGEGVGVGAEVVLRGWRLAVCVVGGEGIDSVALLEMETISPLMRIEIMRKRTIRGRMWSVYLNSENPKRNTSLLVCGSERKSNGKKYP